MLTNMALKALKPAAKCYKSDGGGLFILVEANGSKLWRFAYRFNGKQKLLSGGRYPQTSLAQALAWRDTMKHQLAVGLGPSEERRKESAIAPVPPASTFEEFAREWLEARLLSWVPKYASRVVRAGTPHRELLQRGLPLRIPDERCDSDPCRDLSCPAKL